MTWIFCIPFLLNKFIITKDAILLVGWILVGGYSSLLSDSPKSALLSWVDLSLATIFFFLCQTDRLNNQITQQTKELMFIALVLGAGGLVVYIAHIFNMDTAGSIWEFFSVIQDDFIRVKMTLLEPNLYGTAMSALALLSISEFNRSKKSTWLPLFFSHIGLIISFSRGPILGYFFGLITYSIVIKARRVFLIWAIFITFIVIMLLDDQFTQQLIKYYLGRDDTINSRTVSIEIAIDDITNSFIIGNGIFSFSFLHPEVSLMLGAEYDEKTWISNLPILIIHDTGLIGFFILFNFFLSIFFKGLKATRLLNTIYERQLLLRSGAWLGSSVSMIICSLTTPAISLCIFWGVFAVCSRIPVVVNMSKKADIQNNNKKNPRNIQNRGINEST